MAISQEQIRRIQSNNLNDSVVRDSLAGYLHQHLRTFFGVIVPPPELAYVLEKYAKEVPQAIELAAELNAVGIRPRGWPTKGDDRQ